MCATAHLYITCSFQARAVRPGALFGLHWRFSLLYREDNLFLLPYALYNGNKSLIYLQIVIIIIYIEISIFSYSFYWDPSTEKVILPSLKGELILILETNSLTEGNLPHLSASRAWNRQIVEWDPSHTEPPPPPPSPCTHRHDVFCFVLQGQGAIQTNQLFLTHLAPTSSFPVQLPLPSGRSRLRSPWVGWDRRSVIFAHACHLSASRDYKHYYIILYFLPPHPRIGLGGLFGFYTSSSHCKCIFTTHHHCHTLPLLHCAHAVGILCPYPLPPLDNCFVVHFWTEPPIFFLPLSSLFFCFIRFPHQIHLWDLFCSKPMHHASPRNRMMDGCLVETVDSCHLMDLPYACSTIPINK